MSIVRAKRQEGSTAQAYFGARKEITKEDRQEAARFSDVTLNGYQLPTRKHVLPLANALSRNKFLREVEMRDSCICAAALETLAASLADAPHLTSINLSCNTIDRGVKTGNQEHGITEYTRDTNGVRALVEVVSVQKLVSYVNLSKNGLDWRTAEILSEYLCDHPALVELDLSINFIGSKGAVYLSKLIKANKVLQRLNVRANNVGSLGLDLMCRSLRVNHWLTELNLRSNNLDDDSVRTLADTVRVGCRALIKLDLSYNKIGPKGITALAYGLTSKHLTLRELVLDYNPLTTAGVDFTGLVSFGE
jgi:Ran GTPase-activating protein (RanGAP) involved in mRNA processing and transport